MWHEWGRREMHTECRSGKSEGKRPLERSRRRYEHIIKITFLEIRREDMDLLDQVQDTNK